MLVRDIDPIPKGLLKHPFSAALQTTPHPFSIKVLKNKSKYFGGTIFLGKISRIIGWRYPPLK